MPLTRAVEFLAKLQKQNRIQVPVEIRQLFKLEPTQFLKVRIRPVETFDNERFYAKVKSDGRITVPWEITWALEIKPGSMLRIELSAAEQA